MEPFPYLSHTPCALLDNPVDNRYLHTTIDSYLEYLGSMLQRYSLNSVGDTDGHSLSPCD